MNEFLRACWVAAAGADPEGQSRVVKGYVDALRAARSEGVGDTVVYRLVGGGPTMKALERELDRLVERPATMPNFLVLTPVDSLSTALRLEEALARRGEPSDLTVLSKVVFRRISLTKGPEDAKVPGVAPAMQFGTFSMPSGELEWDLTEWYEKQRLPEFAVMPGAVRAHRFVSACGGAAKFGVFYEFTSLEARLQHFEQVAEARAHDKRRPTAAQRTVHDPWSPCVGERVNL